MIGEPSWSGTREIEQFAIRCNGTMVYPMSKTSGPFATVPELLFEKKDIIPATQQLLTCYPHCKM